MAMSVADLLDRADRRSARVRRPAVAPVTCGGRRGTLSARLGGGRGNRAPRPVPTPSTADALAALARVHRSVRAQLDRPAA